MARRRIAITRAGCALVSALAETGAEFLACDRAGAELSGGGVAEEHL